MADILAPDRLHPTVVAGITRLFTLHHLQPAVDPEALLAEVAPRVRGIVRSGAGARIDRALLGRLPQLEIIANFGVGYDGVDLAEACERGIIVTNTPDVLNEEVADTALGLLLMTVRQLSAAERYLRAGKWATDGPFPLSPSLRDRTVGIVGLGRIGLAIARRLDAMLVPVVYHTRHPRPNVAHRHYDDLRKMAADVDVLLAILPGGSETRHIINASVLEALGPNGIFINVSRGSIVDEPALIAALTERRIAAAGLDVYATQPSVPAELIALPNAVLLPHVGSASAYTRNAMAQLVVDNLTSWFQDGKPLTPVPETPWPRR
jgi:lactate dehydrogenase-like 2-hydroxyacid dehydrogenase